MNGSWGLEMKMDKTREAGDGQACTVCETPPEPRCVSLARLYGILAYAITIATLNVENV